MPLRAEQKIEAYAKGGRSLPRGTLKRLPLEAGMKRDACERCGITEWRSRRLAIALHHLNGDRHDNRLENIKLLCPNCHSQTDNYGGRNRASARTSSATVLERETERAA